MFVVAESLARIGRGHAVVSAFQDRARRWKQLLALTET